MFSVCVKKNYREFWWFRFHGLHFNHNYSWNSISVYHNSRIPKMVVHDVTKISLPPPPLSIVLLTPTHYINPSLTEMLLRLHDSFSVLSVSSIIAYVFLRWRKKILRTREWRKGKGVTAAETLAFNLRLQCINVTALHQLTKNWLKADHLTTWNQQ